MKRFFCFMLGITLMCSFFGFSVNRAKTEVATADENRYCLTIVPSGGTNINTVTDTIYYSYKETEEYLNPYKLPGYFHTASDTCAVTSGGVVIGYYDRLFENLIPDHTGRMLAGTYFYGSQGTAVNNMFNSLYTLMGTDSSGTTIDGYKAGLTSYTSGQGYSISYTNAMSGTAPNYTTCKSVIQNGQLLSLFFNGFEFVSLTGFKTNSGYDLVTREIYTGRHSMVAYGYKFVKYYNANNQLIRSDTYFYVASGFRNNALGLLRVNGISAIDEIFVTEVY